MRSNWIENLFGGGCGQKYRNLISAYADGELQSPLKEEFETHLKICANCRHALDEISFAVNFISALELPDEGDVAIEFPLWLKEQKFAEKIPEASAKRILRKTSARKFDWGIKLNWPAAIVAASLLLTLLGAGVWFYRYKTGGQEWQITRLAGAPIIGTKPFPENDKMREGDWLETNNSSRALITVSNIGHVEVEENSRLQLVTARTGEQRLQLAKGRINASIAAPPEMFFVETPAATAIDYGCAYTLEVEDSGKSTLQVTQGWVKLETGGHGVLIPTGAIAHALPNKGTGTPFFEDATENFRTALDKYDFENGGADSVETIAAEARARDSLTLWYVLKKARADEPREELFNRLIAFVPPPQGFDRDYVLAHLNSPEIDATWREKIEDASIGIDPANLPTATGEIRLTGVMSTTRFAHTATLMTDGNVLVAGGMENATTASSSAEIYDAQQGKFVPTGRMTEKRVGQTATTLRDGRVLIAGGSDRSFFTGALASAEIYDSTTHVFSPVGEMSTPRLGHRATLLPDGKVLIMGGQGIDRIKLKTAELFDPSTSVFTPAGEMTEARSEHTATLLGSGSVLIAGGANAMEGISEIPVSSAELYDPKKGKFTATGGMSVPRFKHSATLLPDGKVLVMGGADSRMAFGKYDSAEMYDPQTGKFTGTGNLKTARYKIRDSVVTLQSGKVLVAGGGGSLEVFDPKTGIFSLVKGGFSAARYYATATLLPSGEVLIVGGYIGAPGPDAYGDVSAWLYQP